MAFQKQFKTNYFSYNGWEYYMEIWVNTTAGTITTSEVKLGTGGPIISYDTDNEDRFSPIISSNCVIPLVIESSIQETFVKQLREVYNERDVYVHLYRATEAQHSTVKPLWSGFVLMDLSSTPDEFYPYDFKITAVDGLGLLKDIDFVKPTTRRANEYIQADMYYGPGRFTYWLKEILLKTGASTTVEGSSQDYEFTTAINWYESQMPNTSQSTDPFYITKCSVGMFHTKTDDGVYEVTNCYEVLKELLKHWGARITYWKGQFWIVQIPQYITPDSGTYINPDNVNTRTYDKSGTFIGSSDNLGDSYWTRYQLNIGDIDGGIQKLTGTNVNYLPQIREVRANNISFGGGNRYGGFPREFAGNSAPDEIIFQDQINDASASDSFNLVIPLNVTVENGNPFYMKILFNFYCTDLTDTYYLQYNPTLTHKYYWVSSSQWTTLVNAPIWDSGFTGPATGNSNQNQSHSNLEGFNQNILFKLYNTSTQAFSDLDLTGNYKFYLDIDAYGTSISNPGSFRFKFASAGLGTGQFFYPTHPNINVSWTNTLQSNYALQTPNIITNNAPNGNSIIQLTTPNIDPFEGMFVVITNTSGSIYGNSYVSSVSTSDVAIVDFGTLIWGDTLQISDLGSLQVYNGSTFVKSSSSGNWGNGILTGSLAFTQILLDEYLYGQTKVIESPSMRLVTSVLNRDSSDGSGLRPNFINPIGRLKESRTNLSDVQYVFKRGAFYTLTDEWDYEGFEIQRNVSSVITTVKEITGPNNPVTGVGSVPKTTTVPNAFGQVISKQIITSISSSVAAGTITSLPIALINDVIFKIGDYFNVLNSDTNEFIKFELNAQQFSDSSSLTVVSQVIADNIPANSIITFNAFDLTSQYQNKTRGTVGAFDITATSIDSGSVAISSYIDDDTFATASVNSLATSESIKAYVDGQAGHDETLQQVTDNGNTTTNSIMIGSSSSPSSTLEVYSSTNPEIKISNGGGTSPNPKLTFYRQGGVSANIQYDVANKILMLINDYAGDINFHSGGSEKMRLTSTGLGIGTSNPTTKLELKDSSATVGLSITAANNAYSDINLGDVDDINIQRIRSEHSSESLLFYTNNAERLRINNAGKLGIGTSNPQQKIHIVDTNGSNIILNSNTGSENSGVWMTEGSAASPYTNGAYMYYDGTNNAFKINTGTTSLSTRFTILRDNGNVGIGTVSPTEKLHVVGDALITGDSHADAFKPAVAANPIKFKNFGSTEVGRFTDSGQLLVGLTSSSNIVAFKDVADIEFDLDGSDAAMNFNSIWRTGVRASASSFRFAESNISLGTNVRMTIETGGQITLPSYGSGTFTGAETYFLAVTSGGDVVEADSSALPGGPYLPLTGGTLTGSLTGTTATFSGDISLSGHIYLAVNKYIFSNNNPLIGGISNQTEIYGINNVISFYSGAGSQYMTIKSGNVIINSTSDNGAKLQVTGNATFSGDVNLTTGQLELRGDVALDHDGNNLYVKAPNNIYFYPGNLNKGQISTSGNLTIAGTVTASGGTLTGSLTGTTATFSGNSTFNSNFTVGGVLYIDNIQTRSGVNIDFRHQDGTVKMQLKTGTGNLLIGTTTDSGEKLQVAGNITLTPGTQRQILLGYGTGIRADASTSFLTSFGYADNATLQGQRGFIWKNDFGNVEHMRLLHNGNVLIGSTSDNGAKLQVTGIIRTTGGSVQAGQDYGFTLEDESNNNRYGLKFGAAGSVGGSNLLMLTNRSLSSATGGGEVAIGANASTSGVTETEVVRIKAVNQSEVSIDGILSLTVQDTPADPSNNKSSIWLDSNWDLKIKITNSSGDTVTKTIVEYA